MANIKSAKKRIQVIAKKTAKNNRIKHKIKDMTKEFNEAVTAGDKKIAGEKLLNLEKKLMKASHWFLHKKTAARKISRLTHKYNAM